MSFNIFDGSNLMRRKLTKTLFLFGWWAMTMISLPFATVYYMAASGLRLTLNAARELISIWSGH